jgi:threonine dehydratase
MAHPYEDERVMAGQGTAAVELMEDVPELDLVLCPVGGGGLLAGTAIAAKTLRPSVRVVATEPAEADDSARSFRAGQRLPVVAPNTIADGLRTSIGEPNFEITRRWVDDVVTVSEAGIIAAMRLIWDAVKIVVEPSAAVPYAAIMEGRVDVAGLRVGIILSGGNVDLDQLPWTAPPPAE